MKGHYKTDMRSAKHSANSKKNHLPHNAHQIGKQADGEKSRITTSRNTVRAETSFPHKSNGRLREGGKVSPEIQNRQIALDTPRRGRPGISPDEYPVILGRAEQYRLILSQVIRIYPDDKGERLWDRMREPLLKARTEGKVIKAVEQYGAPYSQEFMTHTPPESDSIPLSQVILKVIREKRFPKGPDAQLEFFADSLAALGRVSPRRSRNICQQARHEQYRLRNLTANTGT